MATSNSTSVNPLRRRLQVNLRDHREVGIVIFKLDQLVERYGHDH